MSTAEVIALSERINTELAQPDPAKTLPVIAAPGIYRDMDFMAYARIDAASQSRLSKLVPPSTPAHCLAAMLQPPVKTPALVLGDATHCAILEPETFETRFVTLGQCDALTKGGKGPRCTNNASGLYLLDDEVAGLCGTHRAGTPITERTVLSQDDYDTTLRIRDAVWAHPAARQLLEHRADREVSIVWQNAVAGELCKGRIDFTVPEFGTLVDLKSTRNASRTEFMWSIVKYGYHRQGAMYLDGAHATQLGDFENYCFIAFEKEPPNAVAVYRLDDQSLVEGNRQLEQLLITYAACRRANYWPAYSDEVEDISVAVALGAAFTGDV